MTKTGKVLSISALVLTLIFVSYIIWYALKQVNKNTGSNDTGGFSISGTPGVVGASDISVSNPISTDSQSATTPTGSNGSNGGNLVDLGITGTQKYAPGDMISVTDANTIYDHFVSLGFSTTVEPLNIDGVVQNSNQASLQTINLVHAAGLLVPTGIIL